MAGRPNAPDAAIAEPAARDRLLTSSDRVETFSDGVFAITITLLVLEIHRPEVGHGHLGADLIHGWSQYLAFVISFVYVGVVWLNHHGLFAVIRNVDLRLNWINLGILGSTALLPFPTGLLASAFSDGTHRDRQAAVVLYAVVGTLISLAWVPVFTHLRSHPELLAHPEDAPVMWAERFRPLVGIVSYAVAALVGWLVRPELALVLFAWMVLFHAATSEGAAHSRLARRFAPSRKSRETVS